jgi:hypothetical protein
LFVAKLTSNDNLNDSAVANKIVDEILIAKFQGDANNIGSIKEAIKKST